MPMKQMQQTGLPEAALTLFGLCLSLLLSNAHGAECTEHGILPCSFGGCEFFKDANGVLDRTGSCPGLGAASQPVLWLDRRGIKGLREGVFSNMFSHYGWCIVCLHPVLPLSACGHIPARRVARACRYAAKRILTDPRAPATSLSCVPQDPLFVQQRAHRPPRDGVQRAQPDVRREGRETHHRHTHTQARAQALCACRWGHIPARRVARACRYAAKRILTDPRVPAPSLSCDPQVPLFGLQPRVDLRGARASAHRSPHKLQRTDGHVSGKLLRILRVCRVRECSCTLACTACVNARVLTPPRRDTMPCRFH